MNGCVPVRGSPGLEALSVIRKHEIQKVHRQICVFMCFFSFWIIKKETKGVFTITERLPGHYAPVLARC